MEKSRIEYLREQLEKEIISTSEILEIEHAFAKIPDSRLSDARENAMAYDMLNELDFMENFNEGKEK